MQDNKKVWNPRHDTVTHWLLELYTKNSFRIFWTFWKFPAWMWAKLAPICSKSHLQHDSVPFFPLALQQHICYLQHICSDMRRNRFFYFFCLFLFLLFFIFLCPWLTFYWACFQFKRFWESIIEMGNFYHGEGKCRCRKFCSPFFTHISEHFRAYRNLHWANHSDLCHGKDLFLLHNWCRSKAMTSQVEQRSMLVTAGCGRYRRQWVKKSAVCISQLVCILPWVRCLQFAECVLYWPGNEGTSYIS